MHRRAAALVLGLGALLLLLTPGAPGLSNNPVPGDPTPPGVLPVIVGNLGAGGWYTSNVTVSWTVVDPESLILSTVGCDTRTLNSDTVSTPLACRAESDGGETTVSKTFKLDKTAPATSATASRSADANGWHNHELSVSFSGTDATSGVESCSAPQTYGGPDTSATSLSGTCRDRAGNTGAASFALKYDETAPQASPSTRAPDQNGWYNHAVTVGFQGSDATSGVNTCSQVTYAGPDDPSVALTGTCTDRAGNQSAPAVFTMKYDETAPQGGATASRGPDVNGWFNHALTVSFGGSDTVSGLDSCDPAKTYSGPDAVGASVAGACRDRAGNVVPLTFAFKYDQTAPQASATPSRQPNANGWYRVALTVSFAATDAVSGLASCPAPANYSGPDSASAVVSGTCLDNAGNGTLASFALKFDATAPQASASPSRQPNANGWYNAPVTLSFTGSDALSGVDSCDAATTYSGPDTVGTSVSGACRDRAGNSTASSFALRYDATAPQTSATPSRQPNANGWYKAPLTVSFAATDAVAGLDTCDASRSYAGPDSASAVVGGACRDFAGNVGSASLALKYDATGPQASATPSRAADLNGWYNHALTVGFAGSDAMSGLDTCPTPTSYAGPDSASAVISGTCLDRAGNGTLASFALKYDATGPQASATPSRAADLNGWYNHALTVSFAGSDTMSGLASCDAAKSYSNPDSASAAVSGSCSDRAGNVASPSFAFKYDQTAPAASAAPSRAPNANGWYNAPLTVSFSATDVVSGLDLCPLPINFAGPDSATAVVSGTCLDKAGNGALASLALKYDQTAPQASATPSRQPIANGWYNAPLTVSFAATDATSTVDSCDVTKSYSGPDAVSTTVSGSCRDKAGNAGSASFALKYDATLPVVSAAAGRGSDENGWYNHPLTVSFSGTDATAGVASCDAPRSYAGPDSVSASVSGACIDQAGNGGVGSFVLGYDTTAPQVTGASPSRAPDANNWYNAPLALTFQGSDPTSGVQTCTNVTYGGPDNITASVTGSCRDRAGNQSASSAFGFKYDGTAPQVTASPSRAVDGNGWYNHPVTVSFTGGDATSGVGSCEAAKSYAGPDSASAVVRGTCLDFAGNVGAATLGLKYDATGPLSSATPSRAADVNGWYNHALTVSFAGADSMSGFDSCSGPRSYSGPDSASALVSGTCLDNAGNGTLASYAINYDATAPQVSAAASRAPDFNGWYNHPFTVNFQGADAVSGTDVCTAPQTYAGPDTSAASMSGSCRDRAGNVSASSTFGLKYDATAPQVTGAVAGRGPDQAGWYNRPVAFTFLGSDTTAGIDSCPAATYGGPDSASASVAGTCVDKAGNRGSRSFALRYDATGPEAVASADREPGSNGWYNRPLTVSFSGSDPISGLDACEPPQSYQGPDGGFAVIGGACFDKAGNVGLASLPLRYDATAPEVTGAAAARPPDSNGWYNRPLAVSFHGSDATSEIDACTVTGYSGPDAIATTVSGSCRDRAGNGSTPGSYAFKYDSTPPAISDVKVKAGNRTAVLTWRASSDTDVVEIVRSAGARAGRVTVYRGTGQSFTDVRLTNGTEYRYGVTALDEARNSAAREVRARPTAPLYAPAAGAAVTAPPRLAWKPVANATYYNVQLWRNGKIFSAWPKRASLKLRRSWTFEGRRYRLLPGRYRWYVWPGYGRRAAGSYGRPLGSSSFVVTR